VCPGLFDGSLDFLPSPPPPLAALGGGFIAWILPMASAERAVFFFYQFLPPFLSAVLVSPSTAHFSAPFLHAFGAGLRVLLSACPPSGKQSAPSLFLAVDPVRAGQLPSRLGSFLPPTPLPLDLAASFSGHILLGRRGHGTPSEVHPLSASLFAGQRREDAFGLGNLFPRALREHAIIADHSPPPFLFLAV